MENVPPPLPGKLPDPWFEAPPVIESEAGEHSGGSGGRASAWRVWGMFLLLVGYPIVLGVVGGAVKERAGPALPGNTHELLTTCASNLGVFFALFGVAWGVGGLSRRQLLLYPEWGLIPKGFRSGGSGGARWMERGWYWPWVWGAVYSVVLRILIGVALLVVVGAVAVATKVEPSNLAGLRPKVENVVDIEALRDPVYFVLMLTLLSFGLAGFREELWRVGVIASIAAILPGGWGLRKRRWVGVVVAALAFGLGHLPQGWSGVALTTLLGIGLGAIAIYHESLWEAVIAHGFFDASTFVLLRILMETPFLKQLMPGQ